MMKRLPVDHELMKELAADQVAEQFKRLNRHEQVSLHAISPNLYKALHALSENALAVQTDRDRDQEKRHG